MFSNYITAEQEEDEKRFFRLHPVSEAERIAGPEILRKILALPKSPIQQTVKKRIEVSPEELRASLQGFEPRPVEPWEWKRTKTNLNRVKEFDEPNKHLAFKFESMGVPITAQKKATRQLIAKRATEIRVSKGDAEWRETTEDRKHGTNLEIFNLFYGFLFNVDLAHRKEEE